jgi:hypothetical protein
VVGVKFPKAAVKNIKMFVAEVVSNLIDVIFGIDVC